MDYLEVRIEKYKGQVDRSFELEEPVAGLDENPYANEFYDAEDGKYRRARPNERTRSLGGS